jgi:hypothetical protein
LLDHGQCQITTSEKKITSIEYEFPDVWNIRDPSGKASRTDLQGLVFVPVHENSDKEEGARAARRQSDKAVGSRPSAKVACEPC